MPQVMYLDCFSGAAGDMLLGAFLDAGLPADRLREALGTLGVDHELRVTPVVRAAFSLILLPAILKCKFYNFELQPLTEESRKDNAGCYHSQCASE
jgi:hypothetical protein